VWRCDLDGSNVERVIPADVSCGGFIPSEWVVSLDLVNDKLYWVHPCLDSDYTIRRANLDGTEIETLHISGATHGAIAGIEIDLQGDSLYWTTGDCWCDMCCGYPYVWRSRLDGSEAHRLEEPVSLSFPNQIELDQTTGYLYFSDRGFGGFICQYPPMVQRLPTSGGPAEIVHEASGWSSCYEGLAIDPHRGYIYWGDWCTPAIHVARRDGSEHRIMLIEAETAPWYLALDYVNEKLY